MLLLPTTYKIEKWQNPAPGSVEMKQHPAPLTKNCDRSGTKGHRPRQPPVPAPPFCDLGGVFKLRTLEHHWNCVQNLPNAQRTCADLGVMSMTAVFGNSLKKGLILGFAAFLLTGTAIAQGTGIVGVDVVKNWTVYQSKNVPLECGIISRPTESVNTKDGKLAAVKRGEILLAVTIDPKLTGSRYLVSFQSGYPFKKDSTVTMRIDNRAFTLEIGKTDSDSEWAWPPSDDEVIVNAMKRGVNAVLTAVSRRNTDTKDTFSLLGVTEALKIAEERCSVKS